MCLFCRKPVCPESGKKLCREHYLAVRINYRNKMDFMPIIAKYTLNYNRAQKWKREIENQFKLLEKRKEILLFFPDYETRVIQDIRCNEFYKAADYFLGRFKRCQKEADFYKNQLFNRSNYF